MKLWKKEEKKICIKNLIILKWTCNAIFLATFLWSVRFFFARLLEIKKIIEGLKCRF